MLQAYKIISDKVNIDKDILFEFRTAATRGHKYKLYKQQATKLPRIQSFSNRIVSDWNSLPAELVDSKTMNECRRRIDDIWFYSQHLHAQRYCSGNIYLILSYLILSYLILSYLILSYLIT